MLPIRAIPPLLRYLEGLEAAFSRKLTNRKPPDEPALTTALAELMDRVEQEQHAIPVSYGTFEAELHAAYPGVSVGFAIETNEYNAQYENKVSQADIGVVLTSLDRSTGTAWTQSWLFQAKAIKPTGYDEEGPLYDASSSFAAYDAQQAHRMRQLQDAVGCDFVRYLGYCPRPTDIRDEHAATHLAMARDRAMSDHIFDYWYGQELWRRVSSQEPLPGGGAVVLPLDDLTGRTLGDLMARTTVAAWPLSWWLVLQLTSHDSRGPFSPRDRLLGYPSTRERFDIDQGRAPTYDPAAHTPTALARGIVRMEESAIDASRELGWHESRGFQTYPSRRIEVVVEYPSGTDDDADGTTEGQFVGPVPEG